MERKPYRKRIHFTYKEAVKLTSIRHSCVVEVPHEMSLPMPHRFVSNIRIGLKEALDPLLLTYNTELNGIPLAFDHIKVVSSKIIDDLEVFRIDIKLLFIVFRPEPGKLLNGIVNKITDSHFGCIIHKCINGSVRQPDRSILTNEQKDVVNNISVGDTIMFKVWKFDTHHGIIIVLGDILAECYQRIRRKSQSCSESEGTEQIEGKNKVKDEPSTSNNDGDLEDYHFGKSNENKTTVLSANNTNVLQDNCIEKSIKKESHDTDTPQQESSIVEKSTKKKKKKKKESDSIPTITSISPKKNRTITSSPERNWKEIEVKVEVKEEVLSD